MIEFLAVYMTLLSAVIFAGAVLLLSALVLTYVYKLARLVLNETWSCIATITLTFILITLLFSLGIYFGEEPV